MAGIPVREQCMRMVIALLACPLTVSQYAVSFVQALRYKMPGHDAVLKDGSRLHYILTGQEEGPTVVLESGMGGQALDWCLVRPGLSAFATVFSYDRAGLGWSAGAGVPRTAMDDAKRLYELMTKLRLRPPYLLVGHSYGGLIARWFASNYSKDVMGIVLVDAVPESRYLDDAFLNGERLRERKAGRRMMRLGFLLSPVGVPRLLKRHIGAKRLPEPYRAMVKARGSRNGAYEAVYKELLNAEQSAHQVAMSPPLPNDMPVIVLSAGRQTEEWKRGQAELDGLTDRTRREVIPDSWHSIHIYRPDAVVKAVRTILQG